MESVPIYVSAGRRRRKIHPRFSLPSDRAPNVQRGVSPTRRSAMKKALAVATLAALSTAFCVPSFALKYAAPEHNLSVDPSIPSWQPGPVKSEPEEEVAIVGADIMDEIVLGWTKIYRKQYPRLSVTLDLRASGAGGPGPASGKAHLAPRGRHMFPAAEKLLGGQKRPHAP